MMSHLGTGLPGAASAIARLAVIVATTLAFHMCMARPNPPPRADDRQEMSRLDNASKGLLQPFATFFSLAPTAIEVMAVLVRFIVPPEYDFVSGTCAARVSFSALALIGCLLGLCGMGIRLWCYQALGEFFTFELAILRGHKLVTTGPYAFVRHPSYTGGLLAMVGMTIANVCRGSWAYECGTAFSWWGMGWGAITGISTVILIERCPREDRLLRGAFAEEWDKWRERVTWRMIPWVY